MKFLERLDISQFAPEINKTIRSNRVVVALLVALNVVVYLRTMYTKSWTPFLLLNLLLIVCLSAYLFYRVSMWLHQKVKKDNPENPKLVYRSIANQIANGLLELLSPRFLQNLNLLLEIYVAATLTSWIMSVLSPVLFIIAVLDAQWIIEWLGYGSTKEILQAIRSKATEFAARIFVRLPRHRIKAQQPEPTVS